jgi:leucyl-tRNA---protein transferase
MSVIPPGLARLLQFYLSGPLPCPYLPDQVERKLFTRLTGDVFTDSEINSTLTRAGFRRSHDIVYRPACPSCTACLPVRIPVKTFQPSSSLRRIAHRNRDLLIERTEANASVEHFRLFSSYQAARHADSDMAHMTREDFAAMLKDGEARTHLYSLRAPSKDGPSGELVGAIVADLVLDGFSAVYSYYNPDLPHRSLGIQLILLLIGEAAKLDLPYVYLGYWISSARKMAYKARFRPLQALDSQGWVELSKDDESPENNRSTVKIE